MPPSKPPKLYLNEHLSPRLATQLRSYGFDVTSSHGAQMLSSNDDQQFALAISEQRAIVTFNFSDYVELHEKYIAGGKEHWGIVLFNRGANRNPRASTAPTPELRDGG